MAQVAKDRGKGGGGQRLQGAVHEGKVVQTENELLTNIRSFFLRLCQNSKYSHHCDRILQQVVICRQFL